MVKSCLWMRPKEETSNDGVETLNGRIGSLRFASEVRDGSGALYCFDAMYNVSTIYKLYKDLSLTSISPLVCMAPRPTRCVSGVRVSLMISISNAEMNAATKVRISAEAKCLPNAASQHPMPSVHKPISVYTLQAIAVHHIKRITHPRTWRLHLQTDSYSPSSRP